MPKKAFIVGINTLGLRFSEDDADLMANCLLTYGYEIFLHKEKDKWKILKEFNEFIDSCSKTDTIIFYFSGHALIAPRSLNLIIGDDFTKSNNHLNINEIANSIEQCKAISKAIILDCCHAGAAITEWRPENSDYYRLLTSSEKLEKSKELDELKASFMTYQFYKGLTEAALEIADETDKITIEGLYKYVKNKALTHNTTSNYFVPIPGLYGNAKYNIEICTVCNSEKRKDKKKIAELPYDIEEVNKLIDESNRLYVAGKIPESLLPIENAYNLAPLNTKVIEKYSTILLRRLDYDKISKIIQYYEQSEKEKDDCILMVEGELLRRNKKYVKAISILKKIQNRKRYNVEYLTGACYLFQYGINKKKIDLMCALRHLRLADEYFPNHWYIKLNLALTNRLCGSPDKEIENQAINLLNAKIEKDNDKISAKLYRLFYYAMLDQFESFTKIAEIDNIPESKLSELPIDFVDSTQDRLELLFSKDKKKKEQYLNAFVKWASYFK